MNYYEARQRESDGRWDWTCKNDNRIWPSAPCSDHTNGHSTRGEAERHYYDWMLTQLKKITLDGIRLRCEFCGTWAEAELVGGHYGAAVLCNLHLSVDFFMLLRPFKPGIQIISSS